MNNINSASIIVELEHLLNQDIEVLTNMNLQSNESEEMEATITSLIESKKHILSLLPKNTIDIKSGAHPPQATRLPNYTMSTNKLSGKSEIMVTAFLDIENKQQEYITESLSGGGIPKSLVKTLRNVLSVYHKITAQLKRMSNTNQLYSVVTN